MKRPHANQFRSRGIVLTEACVSLALVGLVLAVVSLLLTQHSRTSDYFLNYRRAQLAAESCVERMRMGVLEIAEAKFVDEAGVSFEVQIAEADEAWRPLQRVSVKASIVGRNGRSVRCSLSTYLEPAMASKGGGQ